MRKFIWLPILLFSAYFPYAKEIIIHKPSPCHFIKVIVEDKNVLNIYMGKKRGVFCIQKIEEQKIGVPSHIKEVRIILNNKLWKRYQLK